MRNLTLILIFLSLATSLFAYPVSEDTYMLVKDYNRHLSDTLETITNKYNYEKDPTARYELLVFRDGIIICREMIDGLNSMIGLVQSYQVANTLSVERMILYCENRIPVLEGYLEAYQNSNNVKSKTELTVLIREVSFTKDFLKRMIAELKTNSSS